MSEYTDEQKRSDLSNWSANWIWRAVQCLVDAPDFNSSPKWIATRLNISIEKAVEAAEGVERLGYIRREDGNLKSSDRWLQVLPDKVSPEDLLAGHARLAPQIIAKLQPTDKYSTQFFLGDDALVTKYSLHFVRLFKEMNDEGLRRGLTEVIGSEISFARLTR